MRYTEVDVSKRGSIPKKVRPKASMVSKDEGSIPSSPPIGLAGEILPLIPNEFGIEVPQVDHEPVTESRLGSRRKPPFAETGIAWTHSELPVQTPRSGMAGIGGMIHQGDMDRVVSARHVHRDVHPWGTPAFGLLVFKTFARDGGGPNAGSPRHAEEKAPIVVLSYGHVHEGATPPDKLEHPMAGAVSQIPNLPFFDHRPAVPSDAVIDALPPDRGSRTFQARADWR